MPKALLEDPSGRALFGVLVEGLADRFEPALCDAYARLFSQAIAYAVEGADAGSMVARYERARKPRGVIAKPHRHLRALARHPGRRYRRHQRPAGGPPNDVFRTRPWFSPVRARTTNSSPGDARIHHAPIEYPAAAGCANAWRWPPS